jgi:hypothetical protein
MQSAINVGRLGAWKLMPGAGLRLCFMSGVRVDGGEKCLLARGFLDGAVGHNRFLWGQLDGLTTGLSPQLLDALA